MKRLFFFLFCLGLLTIVTTSFKTKEHKKLCGNPFYVRNTTAYPVKNVTFFYTGAPTTSINNISAYSTSPYSGNMAGDRDMSLIIETVPPGGLYVKVWNIDTNVLLDCFFVGTGSSSPFVSLNTIFVNCGAGLIEVEITRASC